MKTDKPDFKTVIITPVFRLSFPNVWEPRFNQLAKRDQYDIQMLFDKKTDREALKPMLDLMQKLIVFKWGTKPLNFMSPFKDGDTMKTGAGELSKVKNPAFEGKIILSSWSKIPPGVMDPTGKNPITQHDEIYGGCFARAQLNAYAYEQGSNKGVSFALLHIQKIKDGDPFGSRTRAEDAFSAVASTESTAEEIKETDSLFS